MHAERLRVSRPDEPALEAVVADQPELEGRAQALVELVDALPTADQTQIRAARRRLARMADQATVIDAVGVTAAFWGLNLVADATGCGLGVDEAATAEVRRRLDLDRLAPAD